LIPTILKIGPIGLHTYGLMLALGLLAGRMVLAGELKHRRMDPNFADWVLWISAIGGIIGSRLFDILENPKPYMEVPKRIISGSGLTWYGGFILAGIIVVIAARLKGLKVLSFLDASGPTLAVGYGIGRIGCFLSGDGCYGIPCHGNLPIPLCMAFPKGVVPVYVDVYNTPLYEIIGAGIIYLILRIMRDRVMTPGWIFALFLFIHGILRFSVEFIRRNPILMFGLTQAQIISIAVVFLSALYLLFGFKFLHVKPKSISRK